MDATCMTRPLIHAESAGLIVDAVNDCLRAIDRRLGQRVSEAGSAEARDRLARIRANLRNEIDAIAHRGIDFGARR